MFGTMPFLEINPSWGRNGNGPCGSEAMRGLIHEVFGNDMRFQNLLVRNQPNCVDQSGRRHCRTHCCGHSNPLNLFEQLIIEDTIRDAHHVSNNHKENQCEKEGSEFSGVKNSLSEKEEIKLNENVEATKPLPNDTVASQSEPWSVSIDMNGCDEVRARAEGNKIVFEGHTQNSEGFMTIKRVMTLPRNVKVEALSATLGKSGTLTLTETQANKENQVTDIQLLKENTQEFSNIEQCGSESTQDNIMQKDTIEVNMDDSNIINK